MPFMFEKILSVFLKATKPNIKVIQECPPGFITKNCTLPCRYPSFGPACQGNCNCKASDCNSGTGCKEGVATLYPVSSSRGELTSSTMPNTLNITICPIGYTGEKCKLPCPFPNYGDGCQIECSCAEELCSHINGCSINSTHGLKTEPRTPTTTPIVGTSIKLLDTQCHVKMLGDSRGRKSRLLRGAIGMACVALIFFTTYCLLIILNNSEGFNSISICDLCCRKGNETTEILVECPPGYTGENCDIPCRHPSFGQACQEICHCTEIDCDSVTGCVVCPIGYTGDRCEMPCRFPTYGDRCQMACSCAEEFCNFTYGCSTSSTIDSRNGQQTPTRTTTMVTFIKQAVGKHGYWGTSEMGSVVYSE
ncbi:multiple epidermal growth factor-like domains protein 11 [Ostrea edulis]|uniref:multiple epidermal growth factor-like domains protein 11 n=1 Tax=Ostrea edulis TaxID=37623 RepID=UPI0024AFA779|nr:multiple epidermal growth factor-like domains protein 11 [Ostrea edulis]